MTVTRGRSDEPQAPVLAEALRHFWYPLAKSDEVTDRPVAAALLNQPVVVWRSNGRVAAFSDLCIHRGTPLSLGWLKGDQLVCAYHGWHYGADGACTHIPSLPPERGIPSKARVKAYRAEERYGLVWVCLDEPVTGIPEFPPEFDDATFRWGTYSYQDQLKANAARFIENLMDFSHFAWVHPGILGDRDHPECQPVTTQPTEDGFRFEVEVPLNVMKPDGPKERQRYHLILPFMIVLQRYKPMGNERQTLFWVCAPVSFKETRFYRFAGRNYTRSATEEELSKARLIYEQDRVIVEAQRPEELPLDLREELHLRGPDTAALEYRKLLARLGVDW